MTEADDLRPDLRQLFPAGVSLAVDDCSGPPVSDVAEAELSALGSVSDVRLNEYRRGRACAREALRRLGHPPAPVLRDERAPLWPAGVAGSITHCRGMVAAAVAWRSRLAAIGIDAEPRRRVPPDLTPRIAAAGEVERVAGQCDALEAPTILWCVKEAIFKCVHPLARTFIDFGDIIVEVDVAAGRFRLLPPAQEQLAVVAALAPLVEGRIVLCENYVFAGAGVGAESVPRAGGDGQ